jgi:uncharacterized RDD family membrane protein YckC
VIDIFPIPLGLMIPFTPMKQRLGDLLAGTIVVIGPRPPEQEDDEEDGPK